MPEINEVITEILKHDKPLLFMKGSPSEPRCGFSRQICQILHDCGIEYDSFDILQNEELRQALKVYADWPTYPMLFSNGSLIGGLDVIKQIVEEGGADGLKQAISESA